MLLAPEEIETRPETTVDISYRIAGTREEREAAFRLLYASYLRGGLGEINRYQMRVTPYHLLPTTEMFIAEYQGQVIFTMSLVTDGALGVPMEHVYGGGDRRPATARAALRRDFLPGRPPREHAAVLSCLSPRSRVMVQYAHRQGLDAVLAAVHPKHARFYRRCFDFRVMGEQRRLSERPQSTCVGAVGRIRASATGTVRELSGVAGRSAGGRAAPAAADQPARTASTSGR